MDVDGVELRVETDEAESMEAVNRFDFSNAGVDAMDNSTAE